MTTQEMIAVFKLMTAVAAHASCDDAAELNVKRVDVRLAFDRMLTLRPLHERVLDAVLNRKRPAVFFYDELPYVKEQALKGAL